MKDSADHQPVAFNLAVYHAALGSWPEAEEWCNRAIAEHASPEQTRAALADLADLRFILSAEPSSLNRLVALLGTQLPDQIEPLEEKEEQVR